MLYDYSDEPLPVCRWPRLYLVRGKDFVKFDGSSIPGFCKIVQIVRYKSRNGKWLYTTYRLDLASDVRPLRFVSSIHGTWGDNLVSWSDVATKLNVSVDVAQKIIRREYQSTAHRLDKTEEAIF